MSYIKLKQIMLMVKTINIYNFKKSCYKLYTVIKISVG